MVQIFNISFEQVRMFSSECLKLRSSGAIMNKIAYTEINRFIHCITSWMSL